MSARSGPADVTLPAYGTPPVFLRQLRRDRRGVPMPYVTRWVPDPSREPVLEYAMGDMPDAPHPVLAEVGGAPEDGWVPDVVLFNPGRQRECVAKRLCSMCGRGIAARTTAAFVGGLLVEDTAMFPRPAMHRRCARFFIRTWPFLAAAPSVVVETVTWTWTPLSTVTEEDAVRHVLGYVPPAVGALKWLLAVPPEESVAMRDAAAWAATQP